MSHGRGMVESPNALTGKCAFAKRAAFVVQNQNSKQAKMRRAQKQRNFKRYRGIKFNVSQSLREQVYDRDNHTCVYCGASDKPLTLDHKMALSRGGHTTLDNLLTSCEECNQRKADLTYAEFIGESVPPLPVLKVRIGDLIANTARTTLLF